MMFLHTAGAAASMLVFSIKQICLGAIVLLEVFIAAVTHVIRSLLPIIQRKIDHGRIRIGAEKTIGVSVKQGINQHHFR